MGIFDSIITGVPVEYLNTLVTSWNKSLSINPELSKKERYLLCIKIVYENRNLPLSYINELIDFCSKNIREDTKLGDVLHIMLVTEIRENFEGFFSPKYEKKVIKKIHKYFVKKQFDPNQLGILKDIMINNGIDPPCP